jgi:hypothetical protein
MLLEAALGVSVAALLVSFWAVLRSSSRSLDSLVTSIGRIEKAGAERALHLEERLAQKDHIDATSRLMLEQSIAQGSAFADANRRLDRIEAEVTKLEALVRYELVHQLAEDAVAYAEQTAAKATNIKWTGKDKADAALDFARVQAAKLGAAVDMDALRLAIEAHVGHLNAERA